MDLGTCPKCATNWIDGDERCRACGYTAIGAGLSRLPKRKKKKVKAYVEPGGSMPMLSFTLVISLLWGGYYYKPWSEDWDLVRSLFGAGRHHSLKGEWELTETVRAQGLQRNLFTQQQIASGSMSFDGDETVKVAVTNAFGTISAKGHYTVDGTKVVITNLTPTSETSTPVPKELHLDIAWTGPDDFAAALAPDDLMLMRRKEKGGSNDVQHMSYDKSIENDPDSVRGEMTSNGDTN